MKTDFGKLAKARAANLARYGGDRVAASLAGHQERLERAVARKDYDEMRDAEKAIANLKAYRGNQ